jgi:hypothetical protein
VGLQIYEFKIDPIYCWPHEIPVARHRIVIDGICDPLDEWHGAFAVDISRTDAPVMLYLAMDETGRTLYVGIDDQGNEALDPFCDYSVIFLDHDKDGRRLSEVGREGRFQMSLNEYGRLLDFRSVSVVNGSLLYGESEPVPEGIQGALSDKSGRVQFEWKIDLSKERSINATHEQRFGLYIESVNGETVTGTFPPDGNSSDPSSFQEFRATTSLD